MTDVQTPAGQEEQRAIKLADFLDGLGRCAQNPGHREYGPGLQSEV